MALIMGVVRFAQWRVEVHEAEDRQSQLTSQYDFNPGKIVSDGQFFNANAMSQAEIQAFLDDKGKVCTAGHCLKTASFDTQTKPADQLCKAYQGASAESAAAVINKSAKACGISQKVLLAMLQKEQHLISANNPSDFQYKSAMGLSCPDDAACDPNYAGFFNQVYGAAKRYKYYQAHENEYPYRTRQLNDIRYNPNTSCGSSQVYIENEATRLLYIYTPYQPNQAALAAGYGEGDSCSAYGNRNFALIYRDWFGNPRA
ncbi:hemagglutinin [Bifidobacterium aemilianum]|uniref:Hemagglutinin n=2 Tax=Bifidobacterium aemilianum TaxID=2493120 RepID=A0A366KBX0_9BIFI|nr:hemagglutinin [Bifidobacterium aemilianum]